MVTSLLPGSVAVAVNGGKIVSLEVRESRGSKYTPVPSPAPTQIAEVPCGWILLRVRGQQALLSVAELMLLLGGLRTGVGKQQPTS